MEISLSLGPDLDPEEKRYTARFRVLLQDRLAQGGICLPVIPETAQQLMVMCQDEDVEISDLQELVSRDPSLCAHILRIANSAAYSPAVPIISVSLAITRLGLNTFRQVAVSAAVQDSLVVEGWEEVIEGLWSEAAVTGACAKAVSRRCGGGVQRAGLFGLLQDVGKPVVLHLINETRSPDEVVPQIVARILMDEFHEQAGAAAVRQWSMPEWLGEVIEHHHHYTTAGDHLQEAMIANLADHLAVWARTRDTLVAGGQHGLGVCSQLGLDPEDLQALMTEAESIFGESQASAS